MKSEFVMICNANAKIMKCRLTSMIISELRKTCLLPIVRQWIRLWPNLGQAFLQINFASFVEGGIVFKYGQKVLCRI